MSRFSRPPLRPPNVLATDLDGTLIPLAHHTQHREDLAHLSKELQRCSVPLIYVTGRDLRLVRQAWSEHHLPVPQWIICDVGTTIYVRSPVADPAAELLEPVEELVAYRDHLEQLVQGFDVGQLRRLLKDLPELRLQEEEKQGRFKLSYYVDAALLPDMTRAIEERVQAACAPYCLIHSVDPFNGEGLLDLLPRDVSKAHALRWWADHHQRPAESIVFAGDSGNDWAALSGGYRAVIVANAPTELKQRLWQHHCQAGAAERLFLARRAATSGVLEGCHWFELFGPPSEAAVANSAQPLPYGAQPISSRTTSFRVWAPHCRQVSVIKADGEGTRGHALRADGQGDFIGMVPGIGPGDHYFLQPDGQCDRPDPRSRYQPDGVHGPSQVVDPHSYPWNDSSWHGISKRDLIIYELHVGTFTPEGTLQAAANRLPYLQQLGITAVELMPLAQTPGRWNWGYDGVQLFAVRNTYGTPDDLKAFVDACHGHGLAVILDVVYNHVGPEGNYLADFGPYFSREFHTPWGEAFDYARDTATGPQVRRFVIDNACYWLREYHLDGLRLDAVHFMHDLSQPHILQELLQEVRRLQSTCDRPLHLIAETNVYDVQLLPPKDTAASYDAIWCDDIMHSLYSVITNYRGLTRRTYHGHHDLCESLTHGFIYQGTEMTRVSDTDRSALNTPRDSLTSLVIGLQTHDAVGNHPLGQRIHELASIELQCAAAALVLLYPSIPLIFMGEESAAQAPFPFFVDFEDQRLRHAVQVGRQREFPDFAHVARVGGVDDGAFQAAVLTRQADHPSVLAWYGELLKLRHEWLGRRWICPRTLTVECHPELGIFCLAYPISADQSVFVLARLLREAPSDRYLASVACDAHVLLNSQSDAAPAEGPIWTLQPAHAVVARGTPPRLGAAAGERREAPA